MTDDHDLDILYEAMTTNIEYSEPKIPEFQGFGGAPIWWNFYGRPWLSFSENRRLYNDIEYKNKEGKRHRIYGPAYISRTYQVEAWYKEGKLHRLDGPAYIHRYNMVWFKEGKLHRLDGPAVIEGAGPKQYWIDGQKMSKKEHGRQIRSRKNRGLIK
jgi:hypothetical protein